MRENFLLEEAKKELEKKKEFKYYSYADAKNTIFFMFNGALEYILNQEFDFLGDKISNSQIKKEVIELKNDLNEALDYLRENI